MNIEAFLKKDTLACPCRIWLAEFKWLKKVMSESEKNLGKNNYQRMISVEGTADIIVPLRSSSGATAFVSIGSTKAHP